MSKPLMKHLNTALLLTLLVALAPGCKIRKAMWDQEKFEPLEATDFFGDRRASRPLVEGTVADGHLREDVHLYQGTVDGEPAETFPFPITATDLERGRERYDIFCSICHGKSGTGNGMIVQRGYKQAPSYHQDRLRNAGPGYFVGVMNNGFGEMADYADQIPVEDRWRIAAYIKALQLSQHADLDDVPEAQRAALTQPAEEPVSEENAENHE